MDVDGPALACVTAEHVADERGASHTKVPGSAPEPASSTMHINAKYALQQCRAAWKRSAYASEAAEDGP